VTLISPDGGIDPRDMLRTPISLRIELADESERFLHGKVSRFVQVGNVDGMDGHTRYRAEVVPDLWFLSLGVDYRTHQNKTTAEIVEAVLKERGVSDFQLKVYGTLPTRE
jgi:type VI secretion system secreted protein VgrG